MDNPKHKSFLKEQNPKHKSLTFFDDPHNLFLFIWLTYSSLQPTMADSNTNTRSKIDSSMRG
ncbi:hypothetical protein M8C21_021357, partial [Ambrosia artemisiifolia]